MLPLARRRYLHDAKFRAEYPAAKAFLAPQRGDAARRSDREVVPRRALPRRQGITHPTAPGATAQERRVSELAMDIVRRLLRRPAV